MNLDTVRLVARYTIASMILATCSGGELSSSDKKEAKKKRTDSDKSTSQEGEASEPQVVTGAYLTCVEDDAVAGANYGCAMLNSSDHSKYDIGNKKLAMGAFDAAGNKISTTSTMDAPSSPFHGHISVPAGAIPASFSGDLDGSRVNGKNIFHLGSVTEAASFYLAPLASHSVEEINTWCGIITLTRLSSKPSSEACNSLGAACGADDAAIGSGGKCIAQTITYASTKILGFGSGITDKGVCENPAVTPNHKVFKTTCNTN